MTSILIIEEDSDTAETLSRFLALGCGCQVETAGDGLTGLRMVVENHPDVVVCDIGLPKRNGLLVAEELTDLLPNKPLMIGVTGYSDQVYGGHRPRCGV